MNGREILLLIVQSYVHRDTFKMFEREAYAMGFHHADEQAHAASLSAAGEFYQRANDSFLLQL